MTASECLMCFSLDQNFFFLNRFLLLAIRWNMLWKGFSLKNAKSVDKSPALGNSQGLNDEAGVQSTRTELTLTTRLHQGQCSVLGTGRPGF